MEFFFMFIGLGFFIWCMNFVRNDEDNRYQRIIREIREFGHRVSEDPPSKQETKHRKQ